jgi:hypothetical protein
MFAFGNSGIGGGFGGDGPSHFDSFYRFANDL